MLDIKSTFTSLTIAAIVLASGCGGGGSAFPFSAPARPSAPPSASPHPQITASLAYDPASLQIDTNQSEAFTATVSNDPKNKGVTWAITCASVTGPTPVPPCGGKMSKTASASGERVTYNAPNTAPQSQPTITVTAASDPTKTASATVTVAAAPMLASPFPTFPPGNVGTYFDISLNGNWVGGGTAPTVWNLKSGALPPGLTLNAGTGEISGIPRAVNTSIAVITMKDSGTPPLSVDVPSSFAIGPILPLAMNPSSGALPDGTAGVAYNKTCIWAFHYCHYGVDVHASGGFQPYAFSWAAAERSSLVPGLTLQTLSCSGPCAFGSITGTPTTAGTYTFVVTAADAEIPPKKVTAQYTILVH